LGTAIARLKRRKDFLRAASARRKSVMPGLILQARRHGRAETESGAIGARRIGFTVSRKVGKAVVRNRVRRRLKAAAERVFPDHATAGNDYVVIGRAATLTRPFAALLDDLEIALKKLDCYRNGDSPANGAERAA
jgi:ribonuclease P protein component